MEKKPFLIDGVAGNGKMLAAFGKNSRLYRLWWPRVDGPQHMDRMSAGVRLPGVTKGVLWTDGEGWVHRQEYVGDSAHLVTVADHAEIGVSVRVEDFAVDGEDIFVRDYGVTNQSEQPVPVQMYLYTSLAMMESRRYNTVAFDRQEESLVHFRNPYACAVGFDGPVDGFQAGDAWEAAEGGILNGNEIAMTTDGALYRDLGELNPGETVRLPVYLAFGDGYHAALTRLARAREKGEKTMRANTLAGWKEYLAQAKPVCTGDETIDCLYRRSLIVFKLMSDEQYGSLIAAPEFDEDFSRCGGYAYCWGRDAAYITTAIDRAGYHDRARRFYRWTVKAQSPDGSWQQRHYLDGRLAPHWGLQIDEPGSILWGMWQHYLETKDRPFLEEMWPTLRKGAEFLVGFIDSATGLPRPSRDLWEERSGEHTYSAAAVFGGLTGASCAARELGCMSEARRWFHAAEGIREAAAQQLWNADRESFFRGVKLAVSREAYETACARGVKTETETDDKGYTTHYVREDPVIDVSLLGVSLPFGMFDIQDERVKKTAQAVETALGQSPVGGIQRYEGDPYIGGNPWILTTLWLALYKIKAGDRAGAERYLRWAANHRTDLDLLPEQVDKSTGDPAWVVPLTWSHAMLVLTVLEWVKAREKPFEAEVRD
ncbi:glycoside hydrolase family 15 protein [Paludifilum halophilum]|uniref:Glycoside hydrolase family 15 n=1 Tax=Paludifilum halophilum TaxID=1642702 RepID=A0A235B2E3_9BACL|nr:glycoside hydrolase family 15 protein [Paludifilum halophilum]OYD06468.1 glycoside hydrolase family 15 [Paludifilum halophilum]